MQLPSLMAEDIVVVMEERFTAMSDRPHKRGDPTRPRIPFPDALAKMLDVAFFATCAREEGELIEFSLAYLPNEGESPSIVFESALPLSVGSIRKLGRALDPRRSAIAIKASVDDPKDVHAWAITNVGLDYPVFGPASPTQLVIRGPSPATLFVELYGETIAAHRHGVNTVASRAAGTRANNVFEHLAGVIGDGSLGDAALVQDLVLEMWKHRHGGLLFIADSAGELEDLEFRYRLGAPSTLLTTLIRPARARFTNAEELLAAAQQIANLMGDAHYRNAVGQAGRFTAVDGALALDRTLRIHGFGAMVRSNASLNVRAVCLEPASGSSRVATLGEILERRGARHRAGARFIASRTKPAIAFASSQDGELTIFARDVQGNTTVVSPFLTPLFTP